MTSSEAPSTSGHSRSGGGNPDDDIPEITDPEQLWIKVLKRIDTSCPRLDDIKIGTRRTKWHTVRIFVSSTFKDFRCEREILVKQVFQDLRLWCQEHRLRLIDIDLRWGIPSGTKGVDTLKICLDEIERCRKVNSLPYFINLTSARCGWTPSKSDKKEERTDDTNVESIGDVLKKFNLIYGLSVTEMEIVRGAFMNNNPNALFLLRDDSFLDEIEIDKDKYPNFQAKEINEREKEMKKLKVLKKWIKDTFKTDQVVTYNVHYNKHMESPKNLEIEDSFSETVLSFFKRKICLQYDIREDVKTDSQNLKSNFWMDVACDQESFMENKGEGVLGREDDLKKVITFLKAKDSSSPLLIVGEAGCGKSSFMALAVKEVKEKMSSWNTRYKLFYHFVGAVPKSTDLRLMLCRLLIELGVKENKLPLDLQTASPFVHGVLQNPGTSPIIIFVDAINQFDQTTEEEVERWLPTELSPDVRCVVSVISQQKSLLHRTPKLEEINLEPLTVETRKQIIQQTLAEYNKCLEDKNLDTFVKKGCSENPLWLSVACEELRVFDNFRKIPTKIGSFPDNLIDLLGTVLARLRSESRYGHIIKATLCLLEVSKFGLLEDELLELLAEEYNQMSAEEEAGDGRKGREDSSSTNRSKFARLPPFIWCLVERALRTFLRPFGGLSEGRLDFYHRSMSKAVRKTFLDQGSERYDGEMKKWHKRLASYFWSCSTNYRKVEELPYHLIALKETKRLEEFLSEFEVLDELLDPELSTTLFDYWRTCGDVQLERMKNCYRDKLVKMERDGTKRDVFGNRLLQVATLLSQSSYNSDALEVADKAVALENEELPQLRDHDQRLASIYTVLATIHHQLAKIDIKVGQTQTPNILRCIDYCKDATRLLSKTSNSSNQNQMQLGKLKLLQSFSFTQLDQIGNRKIVKDPLSECLKTIEESEIIFNELQDHGSMAEAIMTRAVAKWRKRKEQMKLYEEAWAKCTQIYGRFHLLSARIRHNQGVAYEDAKQTKNAYEHYKESFLIKYVIFGLKHEMTQKTLKVLEKPCYKKWFNEYELIALAQRQ